MQKECPARLWSNIIFAQIWHISLKIDPKLNMMSMTKENMVSCHHYFLKGE